MEETISRSHTNGWTKTTNENRANENPKTPFTVMRLEPLIRWAPVCAVTTGADRESRHSAAVCKLMIDTYSSFADDEERIPSSTLSDDVIALIVERL